MSISSTKIWQPRPTINESFTALAEQYPSKELYVFYDKGERNSYTVSTLYTLAGRFAERLRIYGFKSQDIIANTLPNCPERVVTDLGIVLAGCITMNISHLLSDGRDLYHIARKSQCKCIIMSNYDRCPTWNLLQSKLCRKESNDEFVSKMSIDEAPDLKSAIVVSRSYKGSRKPLLEDLRTCNDDVFVKVCQPNDVAVVFSTSGSTGYSKLVHKTQQDIVDYVTRNDMCMFGENERVDVDLVVYADRFLGWSAGCTAYTIAAPVTKVLRDVYYLDHTSASQDFWEAAVKEKCASAIMVPLEVDKHLYTAERFYGRVPHRFQYIVVLAQPVTQNQAKKMFRFTDTVIIGYGNTECFGISKTYADEKSYKSYNNGKHFGVFDVRVVDEDNKTCPPNIIGTINIKGGFVGYFNKLEDPDPDTLKALTPDGWLNTEDYGYLDDDGNLFVFGRNKDVINYGSSVIYPCWLEEKITEHPDVVQACVVPVSDPSLHQNICACIKLSTSSACTIEDIRRYCDNMFLNNASAALTPRPGFYMLFKEDFPELSSGKPDKMKLKNLAEEKFGYKG